MTRAFAWATRFALLSVLAVTAGCGSDDDRSGAGGSGGGAGTIDEDTTSCGLAIALSGSETFESDFDDPLACATAYSLTPSAYVAYLWGNGSEVATIRLGFPDLEPGEPSRATALPLGIEFVDGTEFSVMGCTADVTSNSFIETVEGGDVYRVAGDGSCAGTGVAGDRSISVVGTFRFSARIRWQN
jgi:hypothetical protein